MAGFQVQERRFQNTMMAQADAAKLQSLYVIFAFVLKPLMDYVPLRAAPMNFVLGSLEQQLKTLQVRILPVLAPAYASKATPCITASTQATTWSSL